MRRERLRICAFLMVLLMVFSAVDFTAYASDIKEADNAEEAVWDDTEEVNLGWDMQEETESTSDFEEEVKLASDASEKSAEQNTAQEDVQNEEETLFAVSEDSIGGTIETTCADGTAGSITWDIDAAGHLTVEGCGNNTTWGEIGYIVAVWPWADYAESVKSATVSLNNFTDAYEMFAGMSNLKSIDLQNLDTSQVKYMTSMFDHCSSLRNLDVSSFDTSQVESMYYMFRGCRSLSSLDVSGFDTSRVTSMAYMFEYCENLTSLDVSGFDTSQVKSMHHIFRDCSSLTSLDVSKFDTSQVKNMDSMFSGCSSLTNLDVSGFDTSQVKSMYGMFDGCSSLSSLDVSGFDTSQVTWMHFMFYGCSSLNSLDVSGFDTSQVTSMFRMFDGCSSLSSLDVSGFNTSQVTSMSGMFDGCSSLSSLDVSGFDTSQVTEMNDIFNGCSNLDSLDVSEFDTSLLTYMGSMFSECSSLSSLDVSGFDTSQVTSMYCMFEGCSSLSSLDVSGFDTSQVTSMYCMFESCSSLSSLDVSRFDTSQVTSMDSMFSGCSSLTSLDVSGFDTSQVTRMKNMFYGCSSLSGLDVSGFNTSQVENMDSMFSGCSSLTSLDVSSFDTSQVKNVNSMFSGCSSIISLDLSNFDNSSYDMIDDCSALKRIDTPKMVSSFIWLPGWDEYIWKDASGNNITIIPQNLSDSTTITRSDYNADVDVPEKTYIFALYKRLLTIEQGDTYTISSHANLPEGTDSTITWNSSDENVVTVSDNGNIKAVSTGKAVITASVADGKYMDSCEVTVNISVKGVSIYLENQPVEERINLPKGETLTLSAVISPDNATNQKVSWSTYDASIAKVSQNGLVTAVAEGDTSIYVITRDGGFMGYCDIRVESIVTPSPQPSESPSTPPTAKPSAEPSGSPTASPSGTPTETPTAEPSASTSPEPSTSPSVSASEVPSASPSVSSSEVPSTSPSVSASEVPTASPSTEPSVSPSTTPSVPGSKPQVDVEVNISQNDLETKDQTELNKTVAAAVSQTVDTVVSQGINYNGSKQSVDLSLTLGGTQLAEGTDYSVKYKNAVNAGNAQIDIKFLGEYKNLGTVSKTFAINAINIASDEVAAANLYYEYKGKAVKPVPVLYYNGKKLRAGKDFEYDKTAIAANKTITVKGIGNFTGSRNIEVTLIDKTKEFRTALAKAKVTINKKLVYSGTAVEPTGTDFIVTVGSGKKKVELKQGVDYTVEFSNNNQPGTAVAVIRSIDGNTNCYGEKLVTFKIAGTKISKATVTLSLVNADGTRTVVGTKKGMEAVSTGSAISPDVTVRLMNANEEEVVLQEGTDYTVSYKKNRKKGTASVVITGIGAYTGTKTVKFKIKEM